MKRDNYTQLAHGAMCRRCGGMVGDTEQHDIWHQAQDLLLSEIRKDVRRALSTSAQWEPLKGTNPSVD